MNTKILSLAIPAHNEEGSIEDTIRAFHHELTLNQIPHEILVVNDNSKDKTEAVLQSLSREIKELRYINNTPPNGFGFAVRCGLENFQGDYVAVVMADLSDNPKDLVAMYLKATDGYDCVFGSRFIKGAKIYDYPKHKLLLNRMVNNIIKVMFMIRYNDTTNAFKLYSRETINGLRPFLSHHFNLTVELPLKAIIRGYSYAIVPTDWTNRKAGVSKLKLKEMGSRYFFIILYCFLEKLLSRGDYKRKEPK
jgi:dolichol-phosphate mannosyltransferase